MPTFITENIFSESGFTGNSITANTITGGTFYGDGSSLTGVLTGSTNIGSGLTLSNLVGGNTLEIKTITGDSFSKIITSGISTDTIEVGINEQNLDLWNLVVQGGNTLIKGGAEYLSGFTYEISPLQYIINGINYAINNTTTVTLNSGDTNFDRIDVIIANNTGGTSVVEGVASANPEKPDIDEDTQIEITFVLVPASSTTLSINTFVMYNENTGQPNEWDFSGYGPLSSAFTSSFTGDSYSGLTSIRVSGVTTLAPAYANYFRLTASTQLDTNQYSTIQFAIKNAVAGLSPRNRIRIRFLTSGGTASNGTSVLMDAYNSGGYVQYSVTNSSTWQLISIPLWRFYLTNTFVDGIEFAFYPLTLTGFSTNIRQYFDLVRFMAGNASAAPVITWGPIQGNSTALMYPTTPNATLRILGGSNITSTVNQTTNTDTISLNPSISITTATISNTLSTGQNVLNVTGSGNTLSAPIMKVQGSTGELFNVKDSVSGSVFTVSNSVGIPIFDVNTDNTILMGKYDSPSLNSTNKLILTAGTNTVYSLPTSAYTAGFFDYSLVSTGSTGARAGNIISIWSGTTAQFVETPTSDIGVTTGVTFNVSVSGNNAVLSSSAVTSGWILKTIVRGI